MIEGIIVASIGVVGAIMIALIEKGRKENARDHATVAGLLNRIEDKIYHHINDHAVGKFDPRKRKSS